MLHDNMYFKIIKMSKRMSKVIRLPTSIYDRLGSHANGFETPADTIERLLDKVEGTPEKPADQGKSIIERDKTKYKFNGVTYGKGRLVLAVVSQYVEDHQDINFEEVQAAFPKELQGSIGVVNRLDYVLTKWHAYDKKRHFTKDNEVIKMNNEDIAVCTEWGIDNIGSFINKARLNGYEITEVNG